MPVYRQHARDDRAHVPSGEVELRAVHERDHPEVRAFFLIHHRFQAQPRGPDIGPEHAPLGRLWLDRPVTKVNFTTVGVYLGMISFIHYFAGVGAVTASPSMCKNKGVFAEQWMHNSATVVNNSVPSWHQVARLSCVSYMV